MAITTTGWDGTGGVHPSSCRINIELGDTLADCITAVDAFLIAHSWELYDAAAGTNARAYRCLALPDADAVTHYGYAVLDFNTSGYLILKHYESWNSTTHVGTYLAYDSDNINSSQRIPAVSGGAFTSSGWLKIQASKFGIFLQSFNGTLYGQQGDGGPSFIVQLARTCPQDLAAAGYSKWAWGISANLFKNVQNTLRPLSFGRNRTGNGSGAYCKVISSYGSGGYDMNNGVSWPADMFPAYPDIISGRLFASNIRVLGQGASAATTWDGGTLLDVIGFARNQGSAGVDDFTFIGDDDPNYGGAAFIHSEGIETKTFWVLGGTSGGLGRLAVRK